MPSPRTVPAIAQQPQADEISFDYFFRIDIAPPVGTKRFTNRGIDTVASIDGSSQTWLSIEGLTVGPVSQTEIDPMGVSWVKFVNLDYTWTNWAQSPGLRGAAYNSNGAQVQLWRGWFDPTTGNFSGPVLTYEGEVDGPNEYGASATIIIKPFGTQWARPGPYLTLEQIDYVYFNTLMPPRDVPISLGGGTVVENTGPYTTTPPGWKWWQAG